MLNMVVFTAGALLAVYPPESADCGAIVRPAVCADSLFWQAGLGSARARQADLLPAGVPARPLSTLTRYGSSWCREWWHHGKAPKDSPSSLWGYRIKCHGVNGQAFVRQDGLARGLYLLSDRPLTARAVAVLGLVLLRKPTHGTAAEYFHVGTFYNGFATCA